jgi:pimeloyl-ACP methyl ester carboxylesterase
MSGPIICAAHPAAVFSAETTTLLSAIAGAEVVSVELPPAVETLDPVVDAVEARRRSLRIQRWVFWGMSGGSFLGQLYAHRHPQALAGLILASSGPYFRPTVEDVDCILCPRHPAWRDKLAAVGLLEGAYDRGPTEWQVVEGVGWVFRRANGAALLVSPDVPSDALQHIMPALWAFDAGPWLHTVDVPTLVMCGTADPVVPLAHARALASLLPHARFCAIEGAGHVPLTDHRSEVEHAIRDFLTTVETGPG